MKGLASFIYLPIFIILFASSSLVWSTEKRVYSFGVVPQFEQRKLFHIWRPILNELEQRTGLGFKLVGSAKIPVFEQKFEQGDYDFAYMNPYHLLVANDCQGYLPLVRDGGRMLKGILVVAHDSPIQSVQELSGKRIAFPSPNALGASLLMRTELTKLHAIEFIPHYVQTHSSVYLHVALGQTEAGGGVVTTLYSQKPDIRQKLRILYETRPMTPHPISAHPRVPEADRNKVQQALLEMAKSKNGADLLSKIPIRKAVPATLKDYTSMSSWGMEEFYIPKR